MNIQNVLVIGIAVSEDLVLPNKHISNRVNVCIYFPVSQCIDGYVPWILSSRAAIRQNKQAIGEAGNLHGGGHLQRAAARFTVFPHSGTREYTIINSGPGNLTTIFYNCLAGLFVMGVATILITCAITCIIAGCYSFHNKLKLTYPNSLQRF